MTEKSYVLGTDQQELERLKRQHELWKDAAIDVWQRAGFHAGQKLFDLGCGPGFTTMELARFLGPASRIHAVDASSRFLDHLRAESVTMKNAASIEVTQTFLENLNLPDRDFDAAYCRWLMIFVPDVRAALRVVRAHLKPGATFVLQEYVAYETMALCPDEPIMQKVVRKVFESWEAEGGDPNRGRVLPRLLSEEGFTVTELKPIARVALPQDPLWKWPDDFYRSFLPRLISAGMLTKEEKDEFFAVWDNASKEPGRFFLAPTMLNIIAKKS